MTRLRQGWLLAVATVLSVLVAAPAHASDPTRDRACGWVIEPSADRENVLFPDTAVRYLGGIAPVPPGGSVEITGEFPYARYMSLQTYSAGLQSVSNLRDEVIEPDPGSANPYGPGAERTSAKRSYTVRIRSGREPANPPPNTLYDTSADGSRTGPFVAYRIYLPDRGRGPFGGVAAPKLSFVLSDGTRIEQPTCPDLLTDIGLTQALAGLGLADFPPLAADLGIDGLLAPRVPVWHKYVNAPTSYGTILTDSAYVPPEAGAALKTITEKLPSGLGENADNKYVFANLSQEYGRVVEFRGRLPTTVRTFEGESPMGTADMRYWSVCSANRTTQTYACVVDHDVPVDAGGSFRIVVSAAANRPANATPGCGVAWLPWGPDPKGTVFVRNMLPSASFPHSVQAAEPGTERATLGAYYPEGRYFRTVADFERTGCQAPAGFGR